MTDPAKPASYRPASHSQEKANDLRLTHMDTGVLFLHPADERTFFGWLDQMACVRSYAGEGELGLVVQLARVPNEEDLRELLAFCGRYGVDMRQLAQFETARFRAWFRDSSKFWHLAVFGPPT